MITFAAVRLGDASKVHLGRSHDGVTYRTSCAAGGWRTCSQTDTPISCVHCLTRYPGDLHLFRAGRTRVSHAVAAPAGGLPHVRRAAARTERANVEALAECINHPIESAVDCLTCNPLED